MSYTKKCSCGQTMIFHRTKRGKWMPCNPGVKTILDPNTGEVHVGYEAHHNHMPGR